MTCMDGRWPYWQCHAWVAWQMTQYVTCTYVQLNGVYNSFSRCRSQVTQTKRDGSSSVPKPSIYLAGLRGHRAVPKKVDLTLPVEVHNNVSTWSTLTQKQTHTHTHTHTTCTYSSHLPSSFAPQALLSYTTLKRSNRKVIFAHAYFQLLSKNGHFHVIMHASTYKHFSATRRAMSRFDITSSCEWKLHHYNCSSRLSYITIIAAPA